MSSGAKFPKPGLFRTLYRDYAAVRRNDPASKNGLETLLCHTPLHAILLYRISHSLFRSGVPLIPRLLSVLARFWSGVEIHPGAQIGLDFFIDHGTGVVIGETAVIGNQCTLFHNVTLGGTGKHREKRHPTLADRVYVGTNSVLLGPIHVGSNSFIGANSFIFMRNVPPNSTVAGTPARIVKLNGERVDLALPLLESKGLQPSFQSIFP